MVQLRPPNLGTMKVYGMRSVAPTRLGIEISQKISVVSNVKPAAGSWTTTMRPQLPDDEAEELGEDGPVQVALGDGPASSFPLVLVLGIPVGDPAAGAVFKLGDEGRWAPAGSVGEGNCRCLRSTVTECLLCGDVVLPR